VTESSFSTETEDYERVETKWKAKVKSKWGIFSGDGSIERRQLEEIRDKHKFSVAIKMKKFEEVDVYRAPWFQPLLFDTVGKEFPEFWGPGGLLASYPISLLLCRGLTLDVEIDNEYRRRLERFFATKGRASFGPFFAAGASYSKDEKYMNYRKTRKGFQLIDNDKTIRVLGCRVRRPNWDDEEAEQYYSGLQKEELEMARSFVTS